MLLIAEWRTVHLVGYKGLTEGDKPDSLSDSVTFLSMLKIDSASLVKIVLAELAMI